MCGDVEGLRRSTTAVGKIPQSIAIFNYLVAIVSSSPLTMMQDIGHWEFSILFSRGITRMLVAVSVPSLKIIRPIV